MRFFKLSLASMLLFASTLLSGQTDYYVATDGNDANNGTSSGTAWQTIQHAMNNATPNSIVHIASGTYPEKVEVNVSGTVGNPIVFRKQSGTPVILDGTGISGLDAIIGIFDQSYITIEGLTLQNSIQNDAQGIIVEGSCQGISLLNNEIRNIHFDEDPNAPVSESTNSQPLIVYGTSGSAPIRDLEISGNTIHDCRTGYSEGLAVNGNVEGFTITNNTVYNISNIGIDVIGHEGTAPANDQARQGLIAGNLVYECKSPYATAAGIYVDGGKDLVIERNEILDCQWGIEIGCENIGQSTSNVVVRSNIIYDNDDAGIALGGYDFPSGSGKVVDCRFVNNTLYDNDRNAGGLGGVSTDIFLTYSENCRLENNIIYSDNSSEQFLYLDAVNPIGLSLDYNLFYADGIYTFDYNGALYPTFDAYQTGTGQDISSKTADPLFVSTAQRDFHLTENSPAINMGNPNFIPEMDETDFDGDQRLAGSRVDIGAYETDATLPVTYLAPFRAQWKELGVDLHWNISSATDVSGFDVDKSANGQDWKFHAKIDYQTDRISYLVRDVDPMIPLTYYRLREIAVDGSISAQQVISIDVPSYRPTYLSGPPHGEITILIPRTVDFIRVYDLSGKLLQVMSDVSEEVKIVLPAGVYLMQSIMGNQIFRDMVQVW